MAAGLVGRIELLRHDAFEVHLAGGLEHGIAAGLEVVDVADRLLLRPGRGEQGAQRLLTLRQRQPAQVEPLGEQQVEREEDEVLRVVFRECRLKSREIGRPVRIERAGLAVDDAVGQCFRGLRDGRELGRPVQSLARAQDSLAILDPELQAIPIELHLVRPALARGGALDQLAELRLYEVG